MESFIAPLNFSRNIYFVMINRKLKETNLLVKGMLSIINEPITARSLIVRLIQMSIRYRNLAGLVVLATGLSAVVPCTTHAARTVYGCVVGAADRRVQGARVQ